MIRNAVRKDLDYIIEIEKDVYEKPWNLENFEKELENSVSRFLVYEEKGIPLGYLIYWELFNTEKMVNEIEVVNIAVNRNHQNRGIARKLMNVMIRRSKKPLVCYLDVRIDNTPAIHLYKSLGFNISGIRKNFYGMNKDAYTMNLFCEVDYDKV
ncbi:MAG: ribosomal protein S18-alanine N-acetyltransferase [Calditerrivibrio sp.]|nr:ribosomal protein S18-alanine N-acetyltransferase [Calditerrivibrio sp.]